MIAPFSARFLFAVAAGSALGGVARYATGIVVHRAVGPVFPWGTLAVNLGGCFLMGLAAAWTIGRPGWTDEARLFLMTGILGGFTTFSTLALETFRLIERGALWRAFANAGLSLGVGLVALWCGIALVRAFR